MPKAKQLLKVRDIVVKDGITPPMRGTIIRVINTLYGQRLVVVWDRGWDGTNVLAYVGDLATRYGRLMTIGGVMYPHAPPGAEGSVTPTGERLKTTSFIDIREGWRQQMLARPRLLEHPDHGKWHPEDIGQTIRWSRERR